MNRVLHFGFVATCSMLLLSQGCDKHDKTSSKQTVPPAASSSTPSTKAPKIAEFHKFGVKFNYPEPYEVEAVSSNPQVYQIAIDHSKLPGVLTIRFNPKDPTGPVDLAQVAEVARKRMGDGAKVSRTELKVAGKTYEARLVKSKPLNLVTTSDVMAVVPIGGINYVILTHTADEDATKAKRMFDIVLDSIRPDPSTRLAVPPRASASAPSSVAPGTHTHR